MNLLRKFLSATFDDEIKRLICLVLVVVYVISHFLVMYLPVEIANKVLTAQTLSDLKWMILGFGGLIGLETFINGAGDNLTKKGQAEITRAEKGIPSQTVVKQNIKEQTNQSTD